MPWDISKVEEHHKGLTKKKKRQWVAVANSVLAKCMSEDGAEESVCAAKAIQMANGVVNNVEEDPTKVNPDEEEVDIPDEEETEEDDDDDEEKKKGLVLDQSYVIYSLHSIPYSIRMQNHQGRKHMIVPVIMMKEGVHSGSHGPLLHLAEELGKFPVSWDGIPVTVNHPARDGRNVSATSPNIIEEECVGRVYNTVMEEKKLKAEIWLDTEKLNQVSPTAASHIQSGKPLDVSVGVFSEEEPVPGIYTNENNEEEQYEAIARNHRPNHLAILPNQTGACSWNDGCGIRANSGLTVNKDSDEKMNENEMSVRKQVAHEQLLQSITDNKQGYQELVGKMQEKLYANDNEEEYFMLEEVFDDSIVYRKRCKTNEGTELYQQPYQVNADEGIELVGEPKRVRRSVSYVQVNALVRTKFNVNRKGEPKMAEPCCLEKVVELLGNPVLNLNEAQDREWLLGLGPERLERLTPKTPEIIEIVKEVPVQVNMAEYVERVSIKTFEDVLAVAPQDLKETLASGLKLHNEYRTDLVATVLANAERDSWTEDELKAFDTKMLEKLSKQFKPQVNYAAQNAGAGVQVNKGDGEEKLLPLGIK